MLCDPMDYTIHEILQPRILEWVAFPFFRESNPGIEPRSPALWADSLPAEPQGKPNNTEKLLKTIGNQVEGSTEGNYWSVLRAVRCFWRHTVPPVNNSIRYINVAPLVRGGVEYKNHPFLRE